MTSGKILTIARFTLLEAARTRLALLFIVVLGLILGTAYFLEQLAITESTRVQIAFTAAMTRFAAVFLLSLHVLTSIVREFNDKGLELTLSFDLPRSHYIIGRLLGYIAIAFAVAALAALPQTLLTSVASALQWGLSLALELTIVAALSLFCVMTFTQLIPAASFVVAFYLLARVLTAIRMMSDSPLTGAGTLSHGVISTLIDILALVLPALDRYAQTPWLLDQPPLWSTIAANAAQACLYIVLLAAATIVDFYRRNL